MEAYLLGSPEGEEVVVDLARLAVHLALADLLELLARHPELDVLLAELPRQERSEQGTAVCEKKRLKRNQRTIKVELSNEEINWKMLKDPVKKRY